MRFSGSLVALMALPSMSIAASLSDFTPRVNSLPQQCLTVYNAPIAGCQPSDFTSRVCSQSCIAGLNAIAVFVQAACQGATQGQNIITAFLSGSGPASLCPNLNASLQSSNTAASSMTAQSTSATSAQTSATAATTGKSSASSTTTSSSTSASSATSATTASTTGVMLVTQSSTTSTPTSTSSAAGSQQTYKNGGGSPFDSVNQNSADMVLPLWTTSSLLSAAAIVLLAIR